MTQTRKKVNLGMLAVYASALSQTGEHSKGMMMFRDISVIGFKADGKVTYLTEGGVTDDIELATKYQFMPAIKAKNLLNDKVGEVTWEVFDNGRERVRL